jgi:hypothetical protein
MKILFVLVIGVVFAALLGFIAYGAAIWYLQARHLVDLHNPAVITSLFPPAMATIVSIAAAVAAASSAAVVALINRRASQELEDKKKFLYFKPDQIEEKEQALKVISVRWPRSSELFEIWHQFLQSGIYLKELAEKNSGADELRNVWTAAPTDGDKPPGVDFGELQEKVIAALYAEQSNILQSK